jgi:hypothetical protein
MPRNSRRSVRFVVVGCCQLLFVVANWRAKNTTTVVTRATPLPYGQYTHVSFQAKMHEGFGATATNMLVRVVHGSDFDRDGGRLMLLGQPEFGASTTMTTEWQQ